MIAIGSSHIQKSTFVLNMEIYQNKNCNFNSLTRSNVIQIILLIISINNNNNLNRSHKHVIGNYFITPEAQSPQSTSSSSKKTWQTTLPAPSTPLPAAAANFHRYWL